MQQKYTPRIDERRWVRNERRMSIRHNFARWMKPGQFPKNRTAY
jgi:hypothetical protein